MTDSKIITANHRYAALRHADPKTLDLIALADDIFKMRKAMMNAALYLDVDPEVRAEMSADEARCNDEIHNKLMEALA